MVQCQFHLDDNHTKYTYEPTVQYTRSEFIKKQRLMMTKDSIILNVDGNELLVQTISGIITAYPGQSQSHLQ